jgi:hypothetical protein
MTVELKFTDLQLKAKLHDLKAIRAAVMPILYQEFVKDTPVDTGNARASTQLNANKIQANYTYAAVLDAGRGYRDGQMRGSTQAPDGMTKPTLDLAKKIIPQIVQQIANKRK